MRQPDIIEHEYPVFGDFVIPGWAGVLPGWDGGQLLRAAGFASAGGWSWEAAAPAAEADGAA